MRRGALVEEAQAMLAGEAVVKTYGISDEVAAASA